MNPLEQLPIPLLEWYRDNARKLPWREDSDPYHILVSEVMLQQTRVAAVRNYYPRFLEAAPDIRALAALPEERLLKLWEGLGYYSRARNLQAAARQIMETHAGVFPTDYKSVLALKGVGDYTAGAICSIAFGQPVPAVDGNVLRVTARVTGDETDISTAGAKKRAAALLRPLLPLNAPGTFNQALMELGAVVCLPNGAPLCDRCPAKTFCAACLENKTDQLPVRAPKPARRVEERIVWLIFYEDRIALRRRPGTGLLAGLWEYPNEPAGADPLAGWGILPLLNDYAGEARHVFTHIEWRLTGRIVKSLAPGLPRGWVWAGRRDLRERYAVPSAFAGFQRVVEEHLSP